MSKTKAIYEIAQLLLSSTMHGVPNIVRSEFTFLKIMWSIFVVLSIAACSFSIAKSVSDFLSFEIVTSIVIVNENELKFPTVSFCSTTEFNKSLSLSELIINCRFGYVQCNQINDFESFIDPVYGQCFRYNSGKNLHGNQTNIINSKFKGIENGFYLNLNVEPNKDIDFGEIAIYIHNQSQAPINMVNKALFQGAGSTYFYKLEQIYNQRLDQPYSDCIKDPRNFQLNKTLINYIYNQGKLYSQSECNLYCANLFIIEKSKCGCNSSLDQVLNDCTYLWTDGEKPLFDKVKNCSTDYNNKLNENNIYEMCSDYCPLECDYQFYEISLYTEHFPGTGLISNATKNFYQLGNLYKNYEELNRKFVSMIIYYDDLKYTSISQKARFLLIDLISSVGGILGLFLGISFLSFVEILEIFFYLIFYLRTKYSKTHSRNKFKISSVFELEQTRF